MKIGLICPYRLDQPGGVQEHVKALAKEFKSRGHGVRIITAGSGVFKGERSGDIITIGSAASVVPSMANDSSGNINFFLDGRDKIKRVLKEEGFDILHFHSPLLPMLSWQILAESKTVNVATFHEAIDEESEVKSIRLLLKTFSLLIKTAGRALHGTIAVSNTARKVVEDLYGLDVDVVIPNGVDLTRFSQDSRPLSEFSDDKFNILFVGRLDPRKGAVYLLRAFAKLQKTHPNTRLIVVGPGDNEKFLEDLAEADHLSNVHFSGYVSDEDLPRYYATSDVYCSPATHGESFGIVLLEAMASGVPVVAFSNSGYQEVLSGKGAEGLVENKNVDALSAKLEQLIEDDHLRNDLRAWGLEEVQKYSWETVADRVLGFYDHALSRDASSTKNLFLDVLEDWLNQKGGKIGKIVSLSKSLRGSWPEDKRF